MDVLGRIHGRMAIPTSGTRSCFLGHLGIVFFGGVCVFDFLAKEASIRSCSAGDHVTFCARPSDFGYPNYDTTFICSNPIVVWWFNIYGMVEAAGLFLASPVPNQCLDTVLARKFFGIIRVYDGLVGLLGNTDSGD